MTEKQLDFSKWSLKKDKYGDLTVEIAVDAFSILELHVRPTTLVEELFQGGFQVLKDGSTRSLHLRVIDVHSGVQLLCL